MFNLDGMDDESLRALIRHAQKALEKAQENQWVENVKTLEVEALTIIDELRELTGRDYAVVLGSYRITRKP